MTNNNNYLNTSNSGHISSNCTTHFNISTIPINDARNNNSNKYQPSYSILPLQLGTINVRGLRTSNKSQDVLKFINKTNINITVITENKLTNDTAKYCFKNSHYTHLWACNDNKYLGSGVSLLIDNY